MAILAAEFAQLRDQIIGALRYHIVKILVDMQALEVDDGATLSLGLPMISANFAPVT
jgi:hypothetical protein